jgi:ribosomal-protein-alanine N-acetyltransferase
MMDAEKTKNWMLQLRPAADQDLMEIMSWIPDKASCRLWAGPMIRFPFTLESLKKDMQYQEGNTFSLVSGQDTLLGVGQLLKKTGKRIHLARIIVSPAHRRRGLGAKLCCSLMEAGKKKYGESEFSLNVYTENSIAMNLYVKLGFKERTPPSEYAADASIVYMVKAQEVPIQNRRIVDDE